VREKENFKKMGEGEGKWEKARLKKLKRMGEGEGE
jgi:hypothetical protein